MEMCREHKYHKNLNCRLPQIVFFGVSILTSVEMSVVNMCAAQACETKLHYDIVGLNICTSAEMR